MRLTKNKKNKRKYIVLLLALVLLMSACQGSSEDANDSINTNESIKEDSKDLPNSDSKDQEDKEPESNKSMQVLVKTDDGDRTFTRDKSSDKYYVNNNEIDFSYDFEHRVSNSAGSISTYMSLIPGEDFTIGEDWYGFVDYTTDFFGSESKKKVLVVTLENVHSAKISRYASGSYDDSINYEENTARIIIDPLTGKVLDMLSPNYYYDYGNQTYSTKSNYTNMYD